MCTNFWQERRECVIPCHHKKTTSAHGTFSSFYSTVLILISFHSSKFYLNIQCLEVSLTLTLCIWLPCLWTIILVYRFLMVTLCICQFISQTKVLKTSTSPWLRRRVSPVLCLENFHNNSNVTFRSLAQVTHLNIEPGVNTHVFYIFTVNFI